MERDLKIPLKELTSYITNELAKAGFKPGTVGNYVKVYERLHKLAGTLRKEFYDQDLGEKFIEDSAYHNGDGYCHSRYLYHVRCTHFIESYLNDGKIDWEISHPLPPKTLKSPVLSQTFNEFKAAMVEEGLKPNTRDGYQRFVYYFLSYLEDIGYASLSQLRQGDIVTFIVMVCQEHYTPTSLGAHLPGLRRFIQAHAETRWLEIELPNTLPKKHDILCVYSDEEHAKITEFLEKDETSSRNRAIALIAFKTGLRAIDICRLKLSDVDWKHDIIHLTQEKTGKAISIPMLPALGNALSEYLLNERPVSSSEYVFLTVNAPFNPLADHSGVYNILRKVVSAAKVEASGRIYGTRITRHSYASRMLRNGIPLPVISEALGHNSPDSTMRYLSTDEKIMAECTLPLPKGGLEWV
jgi:site-specific recombinase XerD